MAYLLATEVLYTRYIGLRDALPVGYRGLVHQVHWTEGCLTCWIPRSCTSSTLERGLAYLLATEAVYIRYNSVRDGLPVGYQGGLHHVHLNGGMVYLLATEVVYIRYISVRDGLPVGCQGGLHQVH